MLLLIFRFKRGLSVTFALGCLAVAVAYRFDPVEAARLALDSAFSKSTFAIIAIYYTVTFLQKMMEVKGHISLAEDALLGITNNKRISAELAPICVGMMPSPGAVVLGGAMVNSIYKDSVSNEDKNFITSFFRHVPESFAPIYGSVILACELAKVPVGDFVLYMLPLVLVLIILGHVMIMRKLPKDTGLPAKKNKLPDIKNLLLSLWPVAFIIAAVLATNLDVYLVTVIVIVVYFFVNKFKFSDIKPFFRSAFEPKIILSTVFILIFKDYIMNTDAVESLPRLFSELPLPDYLIFSIIFFVGSVIVGSTAIAAIGIPLAYVTMPDGGTPLLVLLSSMSFAAMQVSISHICLFLASAYFKVEVASLIKKTMPVIAVFCALLIGYYLLLVHGLEFLSKA
ncbi:DUF401 family protein [Desulfovibrio sp. OttesenSCG-928-C14]|nr:DUF401 family protein [Desulfovibrio sp. OttesenSCG-928-C14]